MSVVLLDTSVFCNIIPVPGFDQHREEVMAGLEQLIKSKASMLLPMPAVIETGNHIAHVPDGRKRRKAAETFCQVVKDAIAGTAPWTPTPFWEMEKMSVWLADFPSAAMQGKGIGDLSIIKEWERQCQLHRARRVRIWAIDKHLDGFDRAP